MSAGSVGHQTSSGPPHSFSSVSALQLGCVALDCAAAVGTQALAQPWVGYKHLSVPRICQVPLRAVPVCTSEVTSALCTALLAMRVSLWA